MESATGAGFVFHDPAGRRWSRVKRVALVVAGALVALVAGLLVAIVHVAPGRAPAFGAVPAQQVPDWQVRGSATAPTSQPAGAPSAAPGPGARLAAALPAGSASSAPAPSVRPSPTTRSKRPRQTPSPSIPPHPH